jgi:hypothetical protein
MNFIEEFRNVGLIKPKATEAYVDKDTEKLIKGQNQQEMGTGGASAGGTTTANVPTSVQPFKSKEEEEEGAQEEPKTVEEEEKEKEGRKLLLQKCGKIAESAARLAEAYEEITGEKLHELFCPNCKPYDMSPSTPDQGEKFGPRVPGGKDQDYGDHPMANDYNR